MNPLEGRLTDLNGDDHMPHGENAHPAGNGQGHDLEVLHLDGPAGPRPMRLARPAERVSVVVPAKNEARNIGWVLERIPAWVDEVILVDGSSTDDTVAVAQAARPGLRVVHDRKPGKGAALRAGFAASHGDIVIMLDADRSMDPAEIGRYTALIHGGYDLVKGSRFMAGADSDDITFLRKTGNDLLRFLTNQLFGVRFTDLCYGYIAFRRECLPELALAADGFEIETEIVISAVRAGLMVTEVPTIERPRAHGVSNLRTFCDGQRVLRTLIALRLAPGPLRRKTRKTIDARTSPGPDIELVR
jgi:glycosyltransferase involved in cell wall biosynthesis